MVRTGAGEGTVSLKRNTKKGWSIVDSKAWRGSPWPPLPGEGALLWPINQLANLGPSYVGPFGLRGSSWHVQSCKGCSYKTSILAESRKSFGAKILLVLGWEASFSRSVLLQAPVCNLHHNNIYHLLSTCWVLALFTYSLSSAQWLCKSYLFLSAAHGKLSL